ncbi:hypothetical protein JOF56_009351 [Kibdelosporangium banguiense]|uniref:Amidohydrolase-related domain-containing protein n=1 Tax=Kibdelosporangium banguiense TaxID=1365924 RepID=A0ABS4TX28_9PSEU|nr:amidohydrolase family protein [Kibdelosporangium banguiense]MBP2328966.1 hypothetical protein [Kibdelosporangium banguiense]
MAFGSSAFPTKLTILANSEAIGMLVAEPADGGLTINSAVDNNGRGAKLTETVCLDEAGKPAVWTVDGTSLAGGEVGERFERGTDGIAVWSSQADEGTTAKEGFYLPADSSSYVLALIVGHALATGGRVPLLPEGCAEVRRVDIDVQFSEPIEVYAVSGVALHEQYVLRSPDGRVLGIADWYLHLVDDLLSETQQLDDALEAATRRRFAAVSQEATVHVGGTLVVRDVRVFDPKTYAVSEPRTIIVQDGTIVDVTTAAADVAHATVVDGAGRMALPGLHDMHSHLAASLGLLYIAAGVTSVRDMGNDNHKLDELTAAISAGELVGPSVVAAGFIEGRSPFSARSGRVVASLDEAIEAVAWYDEHGFHAIKIYNSFNPDWIRATADEAHRRGMRVMGHIPAFMDADRAIADGYDEITHLNQLVLGWVLEPHEDTRTPLRVTAMGRAARLDLDSERVQYTVRSMVDKGIGLDTTVSLLEGLLCSRARQVTPGVAPLLDHVPAGYRRSLLRTYLPCQSEQELEDYAAGFRRLLEIMSRLHKLGVPLWPGTDDGTAVALHRELELYVAAGISPSETLAIATARSASHLGRGETHGVIEPGRVADFILVDGDPTEDISAIRQVALTVAAGRAIVPARIFAAMGIVPWAEPPVIELN